MFYKINYPNLFLLGQTLGPITQHDYLLTCFDRSVAMNHFINSKFSEEYLNDVRTEIDELLKNGQLDWNQLAIECGWFHGIDTIGIPVTNHNLFLYFRIVTWDILYPNLSLDCSQFEEFKLTIFYILRDIVLATKRYDAVDIEFCISIIKEINNKWINISDYHIEYLFIPSIGKIIPNYNLFKDSRTFEYYDFPAINPVLRISLNDYFDLTTLELMPRVIYGLHCEEYHIESGLGLRDFKWSKDKTFLVLNAYKNYITSKAICHE